MKVENAREWFCVTVIRGLCDWIVNVATVDRVFDVFIYRAFKQIF